MSRLTDTAAPFDYRAAASDTLRLALGETLGDRSNADWRRALDVALRERCAAVAWSRSGAAIRRSAPEDVVASWRDAWVQSAEHVERSLAMLSPVCERLRLRGVAPVWLKGAPLSAQLYGDAAARQTVDTDWFVRQDARSIVAEELAAIGWTNAEGDLRGDQTFAFETISPPLFLEVHSALHHPRFAYLSLPTPPGSPASVAGSHVQALLDREVLEPYLALHLAGHRAPPLLWWVDYFTLCSEAGTTEDIDAAAASFGVRRYVHWARRRCEALRRLADGDLHCAGALGITRAGRVDIHPSVRHVFLAPRPSLTWAAAKAWVLPPWVSTHRHRAVGTAMSRIIRHAPHLLRSSQLAPGGTRLESGGSTVPPPGMTATTVQPSPAATLVEKARAVVGVGGELWVEGSGFSMWPFIQAGDRVLLGAPRGIAVGSVVLTFLHGRAVLHRVRMIEGDTLVTAGDANLISDAPIRRAEVSAVALAAARRQTIVALTPTLRFGVLPLLRYARFTLRRYVAHVARSIRGESLRVRLRARVQ